MVTSLKLPPPGVSSMIPEESRPVRKVFLKGGDGSFCQTILQPEEFDTGRPMSEARLHNDMPAII